jgi:hypothetical protein
MKLMIYGFRKLPVIKNQYKGGKDGYPLETQNVKKALAIKLIGSKCRGAWSLITARQWD